MAPKRDHEGRELQSQSPSATSSIESVAATEKSKGDTSETSGKSSQTAANTASNATSPQSEDAPASLTAPPASTMSSSDAPPLQQTTAAVADGAIAGVTLPPIAPAHPIQAPPPVQAIGPMQSTQLLYHALHHGNIVLSLLSTYLSQDAVLRDFVNSCRDPQQLPIAHNNVASSLCVARGDLRQCRYALSASERFGWYRQNGCFRTWEMVMDRLSVIVDIVEEAFRRETLPTCASVVMIKTTWEDSMALRDGTADQESWQLCWDLLNGD